jgi:hypothetical protein
MDKEPKQLIPEPEDGAEVSYKFGSFIPIQTP